MEKPVEHPRRSGFTLIELLIVVGMICVLLGLLLPMASRAREMAHRTVCLSQLQQLHRMFLLYATDNNDQVPIGYRTVSKQYNSMAFSTTGGLFWVEFGLLYRAGLMPERRVLYCPSENNPKFMFDNAANPWPARPAVPSSNIQAGYAMRPLLQLPDDLSNIPVALQPFVMPKLRNLESMAMLADLTASASRVAERHGDGANVLFGGGSAHWVPLTTFNQPAAAWPDPITPPTAAFNSTQDAIWKAFDGT